MKKQFVHMKGTKQGFVLQLDDQCSYTDLVEELEQKTLEGTLEGKVDVQLHLGKRYCTLDQKKQLIQLIEQQGNFLVSKIQSDVLTVEESKKQQLLQRSDTYVGIVRSGQIVRVPGDIVVIGDVNPNGRIEAGGNIHILGKLKGIAHAGVGGNTAAIVTAGQFEPTHIMIADCIESMFNEKQAIAEQNEQIFAYLDETNTIKYDRLQQARKLRPEFMTYKEN